MDYHLAHTLPSPPSSWLSLLAAGDHFGLLSCVVCRASGRLRCCTDLGRICSEWRQNRTRTTEYGLAEIISIRSYPETQTPLVGNSWESAILWASQGILCDGRTFSTGLWISKSWEAKTGVITEGMAGTRHLAWTPAATETCSIAIVALVTWSNYVCNCICVGIVCCYYCQLLGSDTGVPESRV